MIQELSDAKRLLELEVAHLKQQLFGPRSEKLPLEDRQLPLLEQLFENPEPPATEDVVVSVEVETPKIEGKKPVRRSLPEHLEVAVERLEPQEKLCPHCGQERCVIREECSERLDLIPARLIRRRTIRPVLACGRCKDGVVQAAMPAQVVDKWLCGPGLLAHVIFSKYVDHRPLFRVQQELARLGFPVNPNDAVRLGECGCQCLGAALATVARGVGPGRLPAGGRNPGEGDGPGSSGKMCHRIPLGVWPSRGRCPLRLPNRPKSGGT